MGVEHDARPAASLDIEEPAALLEYLRQMGHIGPQETPHLRCLSGGVSNRVVWVERPSGEVWVLKQALAKLRVAVDWYSSPARIHREALGLRWLSHLAPAGTIPGLIFEDHQHHLLAMEAVPLPHENWKTLLLRGELETDHVAQFSRLLATIHRRAYLQRSAVATAFDDRAFFESLRVEPYYAYAAGQLPTAAPFLTDLIAQTRRRRLTLVHGDYSPKNVLIHQGQLHLLDHEVIHFGDPAFDLGFALTHLLSKAHHLQPLRAAYAAAAYRFWQEYRQTLGEVEWAAGLEAHAVSHTLACLLARVDGRSPLEYLDPAARGRQRYAVLALMAAPPTSIELLVDRFVAGLS